MTSFHVVSCTLHWPAACALRFDWFTGLSVGAFHYAKPTSQRPVGILIKPGQSRGMALTSYYPFSEFLALVQRSRAVNHFVKIGMASFSWNILNEIAGSPGSPPVILDIPVGRNQNRPFQLISDQNFRNVWHNGK